MNAFLKRNKCAIPLAFILAYGVLILSIIPYYNSSLFFISRLIGLVAFINVFTQVMLGVFRPFFNKYYNPASVFKFHNYLGVFTLILALAHASIVFFIAGIDVLGLVILALMSITVISSDLKFIFKVNYSMRAWRGIHLINYSLFPLLLIHEFLLGLLFNNYVSVGIIALLTVLIGYGIVYRVKRA